MLAVVTASNLARKREPMLDSDTTDVVLPALGALDRAMLVTDTSGESKHHPFENCLSGRELSDASTDYAHLPPHISRHRWCRLSLIHI